VRTPAADKGGDTPARSPATQAGKLGKAATAHGLVLEQGSNKKWRLVDATTGTLVAADWSTPTGFGLSLDDIETALAGLD
jgi:hypothetical protein